MKYYAKYTFERSPESVTSYILKNHEGESVKGLEFGTYKADGKAYMRMSVPRNPSIRKFFAYTFESSPRQVLTSTEGLNEKRRTFGDAKKIGLNDLILFQFNNELTSLDMYFIRNEGSSKLTKTMAFNNWNYGSMLVAE